MMALAIVMNMTRTGEMIVEKKRLRAKSEMSLRKIPIIAKKNIISRVTHWEIRIATSIATSIHTRSESTTANHMNFPNMMDPRLIGFESMR